MGKNARLKRERRAARRRTSAAFLTDPDIVRAMRRAILGSGASRDSCICSTKIFVQTARVIGSTARPMTVEACALNPVATEWFREHGWDSDPTRDELRELGKRGGYFLVLGARGEAPSGPNAWPGHLVAITEGATHLVDVSIDQAHRPQRGVSMTGPLVLPIERTMREAFLAGKNELTLEREDGVTLIYHAHPDDQSFTTSPDWQRDYDITFGARP